MEVLVTGLEMLRRLAQKLGPYVLLEIVLPGGTLVALALFMYRHRKLQSHAAPWNGFAPGRLLASIAEQLARVLRRCAATRTAPILADARG